MVHPGFGLKFLILRKVFFLNLLSFAIQSRLLGPLRHKAVGSTSIAVKVQSDAHSTLPGGFEPGVDEGTVGEGTVSAVKVQPDAPPHNLRL